MKMLCYVSRLYTQPCILSCKLTVFDRLFILIRYIIKPVTIIRTISKPELNSLRLTFKFLISQFLSTNESRPLMHAPQQQGLVIIQALKSGHPHTSCFDPQFDRHTISFSNSEVNAFNCKHKN